VSEPFTADGGMLDEGDPDEPAAAYTELRALGTCHRHIDAIRAAITR
jgi:hypothetical protein